MHRQRKRDLNLKPNRKLDQRSSRGVMYENEELRLRTLAIADDVDRGHSDLKKLKKENDTLKREMWSLRDECDKLEAILKKAHPELLMLRDEDLFDGAEEYFDDEDGDQNSGMFMMTDEGGGGDTGSVIEQPCGTLEEGHHHYQSSPPTWTGGSGDVLEGIREESESLLNAQSSPDDMEGIVLPDPNEFMEDNEETQSSVGSPDYPPVIQITPASISPVIPSPSGIENNCRSPESLQESSNNGFVFEEIILEGAIQDGGCVAVLPKLYQVTSEIHIDPPTPPDSAQGKEEKKEVVVTGLPPQSPTTSTKFRVSESVKSKSSIIKNTDPQGRYSLIEEPQSKSLWRRDSLSSPWKNGMHPLGGSVGIVVPPCSYCYSNVLHSFTYNSEPSLASPENSPIGFEPFCGQSMGLCNPGKPSSSAWNSIDKNLAVGYFTFRGEQQKEKIKPQDIIDELERQFDPTLEKVRGIRLLLPSRIFVSLKDTSTLSALVAKFGPQGKSHLWVKNTYKVVFVDGSDRHLVVTLSGVPPDTSDLTMISILNQYGQVVAPLEKSKYKGVDISERVAKMVVVQALPLQLTVGGCEVSVTTNDTGGDELSADGLCQNASVSKGLHVSSSINVKLSEEDDGSSNAPGVSPCHQPVILQTHQASHLPPSKSPVTVETTVAESGQLLKPHKPVTRSSSSNPRLETGPKPPSPIVTKRLASMCTETLSPESHPSKLMFSNESLHKGGQSSSTTSAPNLIPPKKPLSRLLRSSPGSLVPPTIPGKTQTVLVGSNEALESPQPTVPVNGGQPQPTTSGGLRAAFYRTFSHDRRPSTTSQTEHNNNTMLRPDKTFCQEGMYARRRSSGGTGAGGTGVRPVGHHPMLMQMNSSSSSGGGGGRDRGRVNRYGSVHSGPKEPLPWCGCWGNGCV